MSYYNCEGRKELDELRDDPRGTVLADTSQVFPVANSDMVIWNNYHCYLLTLDGNTAELFIP